MEVEAKIVLAFLCSEFNSLWSSYYLVSHCLSFRSILSCNSVKENRTGLILCTLSVGPHTYSQRVPFEHASNSPEMNWIIYRHNLLPGQKCYLLCAQDKRCLHVQKPSFEKCFPECRNSGIFNRILFLVSLYYFVCHQKFHFLKISSELIILKLVYFIKIIVKAAIPKDRFNFHM